MSLFGKILLVVNLLAAGGFTYLAMQDYYGEKVKGNGRQNIAAMGLRHVIVLQGMPLGGVKDSKDGVPPDVDTMPADANAEIPFRAEGPGGIPVKTVSKKFLDSYFQNVGAASSDPNTLAVSTAVPNQIGEVARVKAKIEEILNRTEGPAEKAALLRGWLLYQVETTPERFAVLQLSAPDRIDAESGKTRAKTPEEMSKDVEELQRRLTARVDGALSPPKGVDPSVSTVLKDEDLAAAANDEERARIIDERAAKLNESRLSALDEDERRRKVAHLLVHLSPEAGWQKRVLAVVGARNYIKAVMIQSRRFEEMSLEVEQLLLADQEAYFAELMGRPEGADSAEHRGLLKDAQEKTLIANRMAALKLKWTEQATKDADLVQQRRTQLKELSDQLTKIKGQVDVMLARQGTIESGLFEVQREVAITLDEVYKFEAEVAERERKLAGGGK
jgi:hypothetical protein